MYLLKQRLHLSPLIFKHQGWVRGKVSAEEEGEGRIGEGIYSTKVPLPVTLQPTL